MAVKQKKSILLRKRRKDNRKERKSYNTENLGEVMTHDIGCFEAIFIKYKYNSLRNSIWLLY